MPMKVSIQILSRSLYSTDTSRTTFSLWTGAHGVFTSYGDWSNITAASFLSQAGKQTPTFVRFSTVAGSKGSADTARDVHGFATRFYTDEGNFGKTFLTSQRKVFPDLPNGWWQTLSATTFRS